MAHLGNAPSAASRDAAPAEAQDSAASAVGPAQRPVSLHSRKHEIAAYTADLLASSSGQEISFEEVRAAQWFERQAQQVMAVRHACCRHILQLLNHC